MYYDMYYVLFLGKIMFISPLSICIIYISPSNQIILISPILQNWSDLIFKCVFFSVLPQDELQEKYSLTGRFPGPTLTPPCRPWALLNWLFWILLLLFPLCLLLLRLFQSGSTFIIFTTVVLCFAGTEGVILKLKHMLNTVNKVRLISKTSKVIEVGLKYGSATRTVI